MTDRVSPNPSYKGFAPASEAAWRAKRANRKTDTAHEVLLRRALWRLGLRYRKHVSNLPGNPDLVFRRARILVYCDSDFWHGRNWDKLKGQLEQRHNAAYWLAKISRNRERPAEHRPARGARLGSPALLGNGHQEGPFLRRGRDPQRRDVTHRRGVVVRACLSSVRQPLRVSVIYPARKATE